MEFYSFGTTPPTGHGSGRIGHSTRKQAGTHSQRI
jgi:hypothetical protein